MNPEPDPAFYDRKWKNLKSIQIYKIKMEIFLQFLHMKDCQALRQVSSPPGTTCIKNFIYFCKGPFLFI
jgi:hypothetical protein